MTKPAATFQQSAYPTDSGSAYPTNIDSDITVMAQVAGAFAPHAVPATPAAPTLSQVASGVLGATTYFVKTTLVTAAGESIPSAESSLAVSANNVLVVAPPAASGAIQGVIGWNAYVSTSAGTETRQNGSTPNALGANWQEPTSGLVSGAALPAGLSQMSALVDAGSIYTSAGLITKAQQQSAVMAAPSVNPRIDRIVVDATTGTISVVTGTEAGSPVAPTIPGGKLPCAQISLTVGQTQIGNSNITDERAGVISAASGAGSDALSNLIFE